MTLEALIFDVDGTLADTERNGHRLAYNAAFHEFGLDWQWDPTLYGRLLAVHGGKQRLHRYVREYQPDFQPGRDLDTYINELHALKTSHFLGIIRGRGIPARPGVRRLIREARQVGLRLAIATTTARVNVEALLRKAVHPDAPKWFEVIGADEDVQRMKPAADIYRYVLGKLELSADQAIAFEDSRSGMLSAMGAGIRTIITVNDYTRHQDFTGAMVVLDQLGEPDRRFTLLSPNAPVDGYSFINVACLRHLYANVQCHA